MENVRLKMKIGPHEFEAEGPQDTVKDQFESFKELVVTTTSVSEILRPSQDNLEGGSKADGGSKIGPEGTLSKIMQAENKVVSLTAPAESIQDAILLLIYGQQVLLNNERVSGGQIVKGLRMSGQGVNRISQLMDKTVREGYLIAIGKHRAKRYRITNKGVRRARDLAHTLLEMVV